MNEIKISEIEIGDNRRVADMKKVKELAKGIKDVGLINPITVSKVDGGYKLVAGLHRLKAFQELGRDFIKVNVMEGNELELELIEIDENLLRNEIDYLERGSYFHRRDEILKALGRRASNKDNRHTISRSPESGDLKTTKDLAKEMNVSETKYYEEIGIAKRTTPTSKEAIKRAGLTKSEAIVLSKKKPEEQNEILSGIDLKEDSAPEKIKEAIKESGIEEQVKNKNARKNGSSKKAVLRPKREPVDLRNVINDNAASGEEVMMLRAESDANHLIELCGEINNLFVSVKDSGLFERLVSTLDTKKIEEAKTKLEKIINGGIKK